MNTREIQSNQYPPDSAGSILSTNVLITRKTHELKDVLKTIADNSWDDIQYAYVLDGKHLIGVVYLARFSKAETRVRVSGLMTTPAVTVHPHDDQEKAVLLAIEHDVTAVPVVTVEGEFLGAITASTIIDVMHQEHLEDALLATGIRGRGGHILKLATSRYGEVVRSRAPWLVVGTVVGLGLGLISSLLKRHSRSHWPWPISCRCRHCRFSRDTV
jgi:magnesium transporter